ncbi:MAG: hypothetical protein B7Y45_10620 [Sphingomonas sp. 28-66-16]|nr:MAG: hypothetical protein B7Y45_10620 [Sphingomonas sp. 28-66-16]
MRRSFLLSLFAAAAIMPGSAYALGQSDQLERQPRVHGISGEERGMGRRGGDGGNRGDFRANRPAPTAPTTQMPTVSVAPSSVPQANYQRPARPQFQAPPQTAPVQVQPGQNFGQDRRGGGQDRRGGGDGFRPNRGGDRGSFQPPVPGQPAFQNDRRNDRPEFRQDRRDDRQVFRQDQRGDRQDFRQDRRGFDTGNRGRPDANRYGNNYRGGNDAYRNQNFGNRGVWNRDWRRGNQYDWQGYRNYNRDLFRLPRYYAPYGWGYGYRRFGIGVALNSLLFQQSYWIEDPEYYRLPPAYWPYQWVRYYNDALLVDTRSGYVVDTVYDIFWDR